MSDRAQIDQAAAAIRRRTALTPDLGIILGSGLGALADAADADAAVAYAEIPHFPVSTAAGHEGRLVLGRLEGKRVAIMQGQIGRAHV